MEVLLGGARAVGIRANIYHLVLGAQYESYGGTRPIEGGLLGVLSMEEIY